MPTKKKDESCDFCGKQGVKLLKCTGCHSVNTSRGGCKYCGKSCQKADFKKRHKEECRLVGIKASADTAKDGYMREMAKAENAAQALGDREKAKKHFAKVIEHTTEAADKYLQLGDRWAWNSSCAAPFVPVTPTYNARIRVYFGSNARWKQINEPGT